MLFNGRFVVNDSDNYFLIFKLWYINILNILLNLKKKIIWINVCCVYLDDFNIILCIFIDRCLWVYLCLYLMN